MTPAVADRGLELPLPAEPKAQRAEALALARRAPAQGAALIDGGEWIAGILWDSWGAALESAGMRRERLVQIAVEYRRELWLWVAGERTWAHCAGGLRGRVLRRVGG